MARRPKNVELGDKVLEEMLDDRRADRIIAAEAVTRAVQEDELTLEEATDLYGVPESSQRSRFAWQPGDVHRGPSEDTGPQLGEVRATEIMLEETLDRGRTLDRGADETAYRLSIREDVRKIKEAGHEVEIPTTQPDLTDPDSNF